ncbi:hypothetical protein DID88_004333 [Monilinia fructigena]|uniref:Uncharacterized protein n=1 Tax=Monilinia fructigena TaxID=38457 RepID=A0A395IT62_9HELO|nr:hypothetical protein DID88_004333 [Monilinia fructigena]
MFSAEGGPYQNRPTDSRSRPHQDNPFDDSNYTRLPPSRHGGIHAQEAGGSLISRTGQANRSSIGMARGSSSKGPDTFRNRELIQESLHSNRDLFDLLISSQDEDTRSVDNSSKDKSSPAFTDTHHTPAFLPQSYGLTRSQLVSNHSANDTDSFAFESTYERYHTARDLQGTQQDRGGTPPNVSANYYHQSPSYSIRGDTSGAYSTPVLVAKGPGSNAARAFGGSSTISFTIPCNRHESEKGEEEEVKFSPNSTATSAVSDNQLYSGLNDAQVGFYMSTYNGGFRNRVGPNEIIDGSLRHGGDLESGFNVQSFEMVSGSHLTRYGRFGTTNGSPTPRQEALSSFDTPKTVQNVHGELPHQIVGRLERVPIASYGFNAAPIRGTREESYSGGRVQSSGETDHTEFMAKSPVTPLTPLPQAVLSPTAPRYVNDFSINHYRTPSRPCASIGIPTPYIPDLPEDPEAVPTRASTRSRDSLVAAGPHRDQALKSLLGETPAPDKVLGITDIYDGNRQSVESAAPSLTSTYSFGPSPLKRVETEGPLTKLEKSLTHQSQKIATEQELPVLSRNPWRESMSENDEILPATLYTRNNKGKGRAYD